MRFTFPTLMALVIATNAFALEPPAAPPPREVATVKLFRLKYLRAADVDVAANKYFKQKVLTSEPVTNSVVISAPPEVVQQVLKMLEAFDTTASRIVVHATVIQAPAGFLEDVGVVESNAKMECKWVLTERETRMFHSAIRNAKSRGNIDILSRPTLQVTDNQTGFFQVGQTAANGSPRFTGNDIMFRLTPRRNADSKILMRFETSVSTTVPQTITVNGTEVSKSVQTFETMKTIVEIPESGTLLLRMHSSKAKAGEARELLFLVDAKSLKLFSR